LEEFLDSTRLGAADKKRLCEAPKKVDLYSKLIAWRDVYEARNRLADFHAYLRLNRLFIRPELKSKLDALAEMMWKQWTNIHMDQTSPGQGFERSAAYDKESKVAIADATAGFDDLTELGEG
jgi:hypothetical protein